MIDLFKIKCELCKRKEYPTIIVNTNWFWFRNICTDCLKHKDLKFSNLVKSGLREKV